MKRKNSGLDSNSNYFKILKEDHLKYTNEYSKLDIQINEFINIEQLFKELTNFICSDNKIEKSFLQEKLNHLNFLLNHFRSNSSQNLKTDESELKGSKESFNKNKANFYTSSFSKLSKNFSKLEFDARSKESGNIFGNLLSVSLRQSSLNNNFM